MHLFPLDRGAAGGEAVGEAGGEPGPAAPRQTAALGRRGDEVEVGPASQAESYRRLAHDLRQAVRQALRSGSKRLLGTYLQALLAYPDACTRAETVLDPVSGAVLAHAPALPGDRLYPKEQALVDLVRHERAAGRRVIGFVTHTDRRDLTPRLEHVLAGAGFQVAVLKAATVPPERREEWIARRAAEGADVLLVNPRLVQTGLDLLEWPTLAWVEPEFSVYVMRQASRRSWRPGQQRPVQVPFLAYGGTMQAEALALVAAKLRSALLVEGELPEDGLAALEGDGQDTLLALARRLVGDDALGGMAEDARSLEALFAAARRDEADADTYLVDGGWAPEPSVAALELPPTRPPLSPARGAANATGQPALLPDNGVRRATLPDAAAPAPVGVTTPTVVSCEALARLVARPKRRARPVPGGQLALLSA